MSSSVPTCPAEASQGCFPAVRADSSGPLDLAQQPAGSADVVQVKVPCQNAAEAPRAPTRPPSYAHSPGTSRRRCRRCGYAIRLLLPWPTTSLCWPTLVSSCMMLGWQSDGLFGVFAGNRSRSRKRRARTAGCGSLRLQPQPGLDRVQDPCSHPRRES